MFIGPTEYNKGKWEQIDIYGLPRDNFDCHRGKGVSGLLLPCSQVP